MKILVINPWIGSAAEYTHGLCKGLAFNKQEVELVTNVYDISIAQQEYKVIPLFFRKSENMSRNFVRKIIRAFEYIKAYNYVNKKIKQNWYDVINIQWCLMYKFDIYELKYMKKYTTKLVLTAHNAIPHVKGEKNINDLRKLYSIFDKIIVHGENIKLEFEYYFPEFIDKVYVQHHGSRLAEVSQNISKARLSNQIIEKISRYTKKYIFFGNVFYNKGVDILLKVWRENFENFDSILIVVGRVTQKYELYETEVSKAKENVFIISEYLDDYSLNYLINQSDMVILPYRHASMSGVVFTAAQFNKTVLCTNVGSISEYLVNGWDSFIINTSEEGLKNKLREIDKCYSKEQLITMGQRLHDNIKTKFSWERITADLLRNCLEDQ